MPKITLMDVFKGGGGPRAAMAPSASKLLGSDRKQITKFFDDL